VEFLEATAYTYIHPSIIVNHRHDVAPGRRDCGEPGRASEAEDIETNTIRRRAADVFFPMTAAGNREGRHRTENETGEA